MPKRGNNGTLRDLLSPKEWLITEDEFDIEQINYYETIFTIGNGYLGTRGSLEDEHTAAFPQTFLNGVFDHNDSTITHMVTVPDWALLNIIADNERLSLQNCRKIIEYQRILDLKQGLLYRLTRYQDPIGNITRYESIRYASFADKHLCEMQIAITPENYSGRLVINSKIDGHKFNLDRIPAYPRTKRFNPESKWTKWAKSKHLSHLITKPIDKKLLYLEMKTLDRPHRIGYASALNVTNASSEIFNLCDYEHTQHTAIIKARRGKTITAEKLVTIYNSRDVERAQVEAECTKALKKNLKIPAKERFGNQKKPCTISTIPLIWIWATIKEARRLAYTLPQPEEHGSASSAVSAVCA